MTIGNDAHGFWFAIPEDPDCNRTAIRNAHTRSEIAKDMTPLPHHDLRHLWLRYQVEGYGEGIVQSYE
ncbi:hypothetical protein Tco_1488807 [Tanacetum coccineum]